MEKMGKTLFFRSGGEPLILTEEQRETRRLGYYYGMLITVINSIKKLKNINLDKWMTVIDLQWYIIMKTSFID